MEIRGDFNSNSGSAPKHYCAATVQAVIPGPASDLRWNAQPMQWIRASPLRTNRSSVPLY